MNDAATKMALAAVAKAAFEAQVATATVIANEVLGAEDMWEAVDLLTNRLGAEAGRRLVSLLCRLVVKERDEAWDAARKRQANGEKI